MLRMKCSSTRSRRIAAGCSALAIALAVQLPALGQQRSLQRAEQRSQPRSEQRTQPPSEQRTLQRTQQRSQLRMPQTYQHSLLDNEQQNAAAQFHGTGAADEVEI